MRVSVLIGTFGEERWCELACDRAYPSADRQGAYEVAVRHEPDRTLAEVRNQLAADASGDVLVFLDGDDELAPGYLDALDRAFRYWNLARRSDLRENPLLFVPALQYVYRDRRGERDETEPAIPQKGQWPGLNECCIGTAVPRALFLEVGGFRELASLEDYDLFLRCFDAGARLAYVPDAVYRAFASGAGRNRDQSPYGSIWDDHLARISAA